MIPHTSDRYDVIVEVQKFNPYHDALGRFSTASGAASFTWKPGASPDHDKAIAQEKLKAPGKTGGGTGTKKPKKQTVQDQTSKPKKPKQPTNEDPTAKWRPKWMPETKRRSHKTQNHHLPGTHEDWEAVQDQTGCSTEEAQEMHYSVLNFSKQGYEDIRKYAHKGPPPSTYKTDAENLEKFISASPQWDDGPLYRGISTSSSQAKKILAAAKAGKPLSQNGPSSWSSDRDIAENFGVQRHTGDVTIIFKTSGKQNGTSIKHLSNFPWEDEVLMSNDARWKAASAPVEVSPGVWEIECEAIDVP